MYSYDNKKVRDSFKDTVEKSNWTKIIVDIKYQL